MRQTGARVLIGFIEQHILPRLSPFWLDAFTSTQALSRIALSAAPQALTFEATPLPLVVRLRNNPVARRLVLS